MEVSDRPTTLASIVADVAMDSAHAFADHHGAKVSKMFISLQLSGQPDGEADSVSAASGTEISLEIEVSQRQLLGLLVEDARAIARPMDYDVRIVPTRRGD